MSEWSMAIEGLLTGTQVDAQMVQVLGKNHYNSAAKLRKSFHST